MRTYEKSYMCDKGKKYMYIYVLYSLNDKPTDKVKYVLLSNITGIIFPQKTF